MSNTTQINTAKEQFLPIRRPVTTAMLFLTLAVFGWKSYQQLSLNLMPDISYPTLTVRTEFEGAAPEDVEKLLTRPLEETLSTVNGMVEISSISSPGLSEIVLEYKWDTDMNMAQQDVRDRLDLFTPPEEVTDKPVILRYDPTLDPVMRVAITGTETSLTDDAAQAAQARKELSVIRDVAERHIKSDLEGELGIAQVLVKGGREEEIQILLDSERLKNLGIAPATVANALAQQNINLSGGGLKEGKTEYLVRTLNQYQNIEEIRQTIIPDPQNRQIRLDDVATVVQGLKEQKTLVHINGREAVELAIFKWGDANTVEVANMLKDMMGFPREKSGMERFTDFMNEQIRRMSAKSDPTKSSSSMQAAKNIQSRLPKFAHLTLISDQSRFIVGAIQEVKSTAYLGGVLALLLIYLFLRELKSTLIIGISIPLSIIAAFIPMFMMDISLNIMSLGGLALGVGMLVDDSIIVLESIVRCKEEGDNDVDAASRGTREVFGADASSTFTTIAVFLPIAFVEGVAGQLFGDLALTVTFSLLASLAVALYLIPMLASRRPLAFLSNLDVVWVLRGYRRSRKAGMGRMQACAAIPHEALCDAKQWFVECVAYHANSAKASFQFCMSNANGPIVGVFRKLLLPFAALQVLALIGLFGLTLILKTLSAFVIFILFIITTVLAAIIWVVGGALSIVLWLPLTIFEKCFNAFRNSYSVFLRFLIPLGPGVLILVSLLAVHAVVLAPKLGTELIPPMKQGEFGVRMEAKPGTRLEKTAELAGSIERVATEMPEIDSVAVEVGREESKESAERGENIAEFTIRIKDPEQNAQHQDDIIERLRTAVDGLTPCNVTFTLPVIFSFKSAVELQIRGDELDELRRIADDTLTEVRGVDGVKDAEVSMKQGYPEVIIQLDRDLLAAKGLNPDTVAQRLRTEVQGDMATRFSRGGDNIDMRVRTEQSRLARLNDLRAVSVSDGAPPVPLESVAHISVQDGPSEIRRVDQRRTATITANVEGRDLGAVTKDIEQRLQHVDIPKDYQFVLAGQNREIQTSYKSLQFALILAFFLVYVVMACQFESIHQPALVMTTVPMAFVGVIYALYFMHIHVSIIVFIGGIVLAGVVVNDAIILVDYTNQLRARGMTKREAVILAGRVRLRPVMITTLTTIFGLVPMAVQTGQGAEMRQPLAITIIAGLSSATILTLVIIPIVYDLFGGRDKPIKPEAPVS